MSIQREEYCKLLIREERLKSGFVRIHGLGELVFRGISCRLSSENHKETSLILSNGDDAQNVHQDKFTT